MVHEEIPGLLLNFHLRFHIFVKPGNVEPRSAVKKKKEKTWGKFYLKTFGIALTFCKENQSSIQMEQKSNR